MLKLSPYLEAVQQIETQFEFLRFAFQTLSANRRKEFFDRKRNFAIHQFESGLEMVPGLERDFVEKVKRYNERKLTRKWSGETRELYRTQYVPDDLNKSELLLLVALFEGYLKEVYEALLRAEPRRAFAKSNKEEKLSEIFADNVEEWRKSRFFQKVVEGNVKGFDHIAFSQRMTNLMDTYKLNVDSKDIETANELIDRRHTISHRWTDRNEVKHVSPQELKDARRIFRSIPSRLVKQASEKYPKHIIG